jgi:hypothetical protein
MKQRKEIELELEIQKQQEDFQKVEEIQQTVNLHFLNHNILHQDIILFLQQD